MMRTTLSRTFAALLLAAPVVLSALPLDPGGESDSFVPRQKKLYKAISKRNGEGKNSKPFLSVHALMALLDNTAQVYSGVPTPVTLILRNERKKPVPDGVVVVVKMPKEFKVLGTGKTLDMPESKDLGDGTVMHRFKLHKFSRLVVWEGSNAHGGSLSMLIKADLPAGANTWPMEYYLEYEGTTTQPYTTYLQVAEMPKNIHTPKIFRTGINAYLDVSFQQDKAAKEFTKFYTGLGFNSFSAARDVMPNVVDDMKKAGVEIFTENWFVHDGYNISDGNDDREFVTLEGGKPVRHPKQATCPTAIYGDEKFFNDNIRDDIEEKFYAKPWTNYVMPNWEPEHQFAGKGCFCDDCRKEFLKFSGIAEADLAAVWPKKVQKTYGEQWTKFRSWQHGQIVKKINDAFKELNAKHNITINFLPLINYASLLPSMKAMYHESNPADYVKHLDYIEAWGPYIYQHYTTPWEYRAGVYLAPYFSGGFLMKHYPGKKFLAFPHGALFGISTNYFSSAEGIPFEVLCYFVNRWEGALIYRFPQGLDTRHWTELAKANNLIALNEDAVMKGTENKSVKVEIQSPMPPPLVRQRADQYNTGRDECFELGLGKLEMLQSRAFDYNGKTVVAVGNFWQRGEAFVRLSFPDANENEFYALYENGVDRSYGNDKGSNKLSGKELRDGILVQIGALRWSFFTLEKYADGKKYGEIFSPQYMATYMASKMRGIKEELALETNRRFVQEGTLRVSVGDDGMVWRDLEIATTGDNRLNAQKVPVKIQTNTGDRWAQLTFRLPNSLSFSKQTLEVDVKRAATIQDKFIEECTVKRYLSDPDFRPAVAEQKHYEIGYDVESFTGKPIALRDNEFKHGIGVHAPSKQVFKLDPADKWKYFTAFVGLSNWSVPSGSAVFRVYTDGKLQFDSGILHMSDNPVPVCVKLSGVKELTLELSDGGDGVQGDFGSWADACLRKKEKK